MTSWADGITWPTASLGSVVRLVGGGTASKTRSDFWNGTIPWVSPKDMSGREVHDAADHITRAAADESATQIVPAGSVLIVVTIRYPCPPFPCEPRSNPRRLEPGFEGTASGRPVAAGLPRLCTRSQVRLCASPVCEAIWRKTWCADRPELRSPCPVQRSRTG
jgi:type I restriction enzyme S subunit